MSKKTGQPPFAEVLKQRMREIDEASERWKQEHPEEESVSAKGKPQMDESVRDEPGLAALTARSDDIDYFFEPGPPVPVLPSAKRPAAPAAPFDTETLLNDLIVECRSLLRDVAFRSACLTPDADDRIRFISAAESLAITAAKVGETIAHLRTGGTPAIEEHRHRMIYEHTQTTVAPPSPPGNTP
jgi:hypothetical protein